MKAKVMGAMIAVVLVLVAMGGTAISDTWTTIDLPDSRYTSIHDMDGSNLVGQEGSNGGFLYNMKTQSWTLFANHPVTGIDGSNLVGFQKDYTGATRPSVYNGISWTNLDGPAVPGRQATQINGINGSNCVGSYQVSAPGGPPNSPSSHGFIYNITSHSWTLIDMPGAPNTMINGIDGSNLVGVYYDRNDVGHGFLYDGADHWMTLDMPGAEQTYIRGISGENLVGFYDFSGSGRHSFLYNTATELWTTIEKPGAGNTDVWGIDGSNLVGQYYANNDTHGFIYAIPEPATLSLLTLGGLAVIWRKR